MIFQNIINYISEYHHTTKYSGRFTKKGLEQKYQVNII